MKWCKLAFRVSFHKVDEHEGETAAIAVHARGTNPYGPEYALVRVCIGDATAEHDIYDDDALCNYPQSGERILARSKYGPCGVTITSTASALIQWVTRTVSG